MVAGLLALMIGVAPVSAAAPDSTPFDRFAFRYETGWGNYIDTIDGTIARDNCYLPPSQGKARLSKAELRRVYDRLMTLRVFDLEEPAPSLGNGPQTVWSPQTWTRIDVRAGRTRRHFEWNPNVIGSPGPPFPPDWQRLWAIRAVLDSTLRALPEYQKLPHKYCARL